jgi:hypothetical protein
MSVRFNSSGGIVVSKGIKSITVKVEFVWNDVFYIGGISLKQAQLSQEGKSFTWSRGTFDDQGKKTKTVTLFSDTGSDKTWSISYFKANQGEIDTLVGTSPAGKDNDNQIYFYDANGTDKNTRVKLSADSPEYYSAAPPPPPPVTEPPTPPDEPPPPPPENRTVVNQATCNEPTPWSNLLPTCANSPRGTSSTEGLQIRVSGTNVTLNLRNYENKLVDLKITHEVTGSWTQGFSFSIPNCSDISPNTGGTPYNKSSYLTTSIRGTNTFYAYNLDGGDYNYTFGHSSTPGSRPTRTNYTISRSESSFTNETGGTTTVVTYRCNYYTETWSGRWPYCDIEVASIRNGGNKVQWAYEDGSGSSFGKQFVTVEVIGVRNAVPFTGPVCFSTLRSNAWIADTSNPGANGYCLGHYKDHSDKVRFRVPSLSQSKLDFPEPLCVDFLRGVAGADSPGEDLGEVSSEYAVIHVFDEDFNETTTLITNQTITVTPVNEDDDTYTDPGNQNDPLLNTLDRRYYLVRFNDFGQNKSVLPGASNINISIGQNLTAGGISSDIVVSKKENDPNDQTLMRVWFYTSKVESVPYTDDVTHSLIGVDTPPTDILDSPTVLVQALGADDLGIDGGYPDLNLPEKKHYRVTFKDETIIEGGNETQDTNIQIIINANKTAEGDVIPISVSKLEAVGSEGKVFDLWFEGYRSGIGLDNVYVSDWSISRSKEVNFTGNTYVRNWSMAVID